jgi:hypothetical protein
LEISNVKVIKSDTGERLTGTVGNFELWYEFPPGFALAERIEPFVCAALIPSMQAGSDVVLPDDMPLCPLLVKNLYKVQEIFLCHQVHLSLSLKPVLIKGGRPQHADNNGKTASFFSGGVDGTYTYLKEKQNIDDLLFVKGIDIQVHNDALYEEAFRRNQQFLASEGRDLIPVASNVRYLGYHHNMSWNSWNGGGLASIAMAAGYKHCLIASGKSYAEFFPEGSSYVSDHLWSSASCQIEHHGAGAARIQKTAVIAANPGALSILRVCWQDKNYNCGECEKCLRTMVALELLGVKGAPFPAWDDMQLKKLSRLRFYSEKNLANFQQVQRTAKDQNHKQIYAVVTKIMNHFYWRQLIKECDRLLFGGRLFNLRRKAKTP